MEPKLKVEAISYSIHFQSTTQHCLLAIQDLIRNQYTLDYFPEACYIPLVHFSVYSHKFVGSVPSYELKIELFSGPQVLLKI